MDDKQRRRRAGRKKKILSPDSRRVLQDLADQDWQLIESNTQRTISELNNVGTAAPHNQFLHMIDDGGEEKLEETSATARTADSNSHDKSEQNAQKVTRELPRQKQTSRRTRLPTLDSQKSPSSPGHIEKDEDKPMESYANVKEVLIYLTSVMIRYHMD